VQPIVDIDTILHRVRDKIANRAQEGAITTVPNQSNAPQRPLSLGGSDNSDVSLNQLLAYDDEEFISAAYGYILRRNPDPSGVENYLALLRGGISKLDVLFSLRFSEEGRRIGVKVTGVDFTYWKWRATKARIYIRQTLSDWLGVPVENRNIRKANDEVVKISQLQQHIARLEYSKANRSESEEFTAHYDALLATKGDRQEVLDLAGQIAKKADHEKVSAELAALLQTVTELQQHIARLEFGKANRSESEAFAERFDSILATKADRHEVSEIIGQIARKADEERVIARLAAKADQREMLELAGKIVRKADEERVSAGLTDLLQTVMEMQKHIARLEFDKANRSESAAFAERFDPILAAKVDRQEISELVRQVAGKADLLDLNAIQDRVRECEQSLVEPSQMTCLSKDVVAATHQISVLRQDLQDCHRRLGVFLEQARKRMPEPFTAEQIKEMLTEGKESLDSLYVAFEDRFRGSLEIVREGTKVYLPYIQEALRRTNGGVVLDVACGRGEWLDVLREEGIKARGVDLNTAAIELCRQQELEVTLEDALTYVLKQRKSSVSAITSFHFIEHIDYRSLVKLLDEALRILKPGGIAIFETPNARNILVTAGDFYRDPTHRHPVFPETVEAVAEFRGFCNSRSYCVNESRTELIPLAQYRFDDLQDYVVVPRDLAWVGVKPA
jgi:2-polyprenyl-3-methyl-5-hydroxy-6-metoxy-1,4-benzoquinol methylase